jgi:hypothetical protein
MSFPRRATSLCLSVPGNWSLRCSLSDGSPLNSPPRDAFVAALPQRQKLFDLMGASAIRLTALTENRLDDNYLLVHTQWAADLRDPSRAPLELSSSFLLRQDGETLAVVFYLNHQDVRRLSRES